VTKKSFFCVFIATFIFFGVMEDAAAQTNLNLPAKFALPKSGLELERRSQVGSFYDVVGRKSALLGYEHRAAEAWVYPLKVIDEFDLSFRIEGYNREYRAADLLVKTTVTPEATVFTYSHAAFTVRQIMFAPVNEQGIVILLDVDSTLPITVSASFKPKLRLMWLAGSATPSIGFDEIGRRYFISEESGKFVGVVGSPNARDVSMMPYQEEPEDVPAKFIIETTPDGLRKSYIPIIIAASMNGREEARKTYDRLLASIPELYQQNADYYARLESNHTQIKTPDEKLNRAFAWAKVGVDKGVATNPFLGTGLLAGFRTSGESERPGFAWFFGRDALWTVLATNSYGDLPTSRTALEFLRKYQRSDGKIPHEISQSATFVDWFNAFPYAWASADATPLYIVACADYYRISGDKEFLNASKDSLIKAYQFTAATDTDGNGLVENTRFGHGWVEGGDLYPPHEEIYQQGVWFAALSAMTEFAGAWNDKKLAAETLERGKKLRETVEQTYWLADKNFYAYSTKLLTEKPLAAEAGVNRAARQTRLNELAKSTIYDEDTVMPAVPLWFKMLEDERAQKSLDRIGGAKIATDWGVRIIANDSRLYDPLSYHHGSVWGLFTGWASLAAYNYGRPHVGFQALYANAQLKESGNALGYITELLSGDFNAPFGRSSHHQIWSEAMIITPALRGLFGVEVEGKILRFAPQLPANWDETEVKNIVYENAKFGFRTSRTNGKLTVKITANGASSLEKIVIAPAFSFNAVIKTVTVNGKPAKFNLQKMGDVQRIETILENPQNTEVVFNYEEGTEVFYTPAPLLPAQRNQDLKIIRAVADEQNLRLIVEGLGGRAYTLGVRSGYKLNEVEGVKIEQNGGLFGKIAVKFEGAENEFVRREIVIPLHKKS
jgi:glycogen debranching enzyme